MWCNKQPNKQEVNKLWIEALRNDKKLSLESYSERSVSIKNRSPVGTKFPKLLLLVLTGCGNFINIWSAKSKQKLTAKGNLGPHVFRDENIKYNLISK